MGKSITTTRTLFEEQDGRCYYCDEEMLWTPVVDGEFKKEYYYRQATFEHVTLKSKGGTYGKENGVCACWKCNTMRGKLPQDVFIENLKYITEQWDKGNRNPHLENGKLVISSPKTERRLQKKQKRREMRANNFLSAGFCITHFAVQIGEPVQDVFLAQIFSTTYNMIEATYD